MLRQGQSDRNISMMQSIGILSIPRATPESHDIVAQMSFNHSIQNAQYVHYSDPEWHLHGRDISIVDETAQFLSKAPIDGTSSVIGYIRKSNQARLVGLEVSYDPESPTGKKLFGNPWIVGQVSDAQRMEPFVLDFANGERITTIRVCMTEFKDPAYWQRAAPNTKFASGIQIKTSKKRSRVLGDMQARSPRGKDPYIIVLNFKEKVGSARFK